VRQAAFVASKEKWTAPPKMALYNCRRMHLTAVSREHVRPIFHPGWELGRGLVRVCVMKQFIQREGVCGDGKKIMCQSVHQTQMLLQLQQLGPALPLRCEVP
jgi:hypothetical protein